MIRGSFDQGKFLNALLYFAKNTDPKQLGKTKLNKLLYYSDFIHFKRYGRPITGDRYIRLEKGPVPSTAHAIISEASGKLPESSRAKLLEGKIKITATKYHEKNQMRIIALVDPDLTVFSDSELEVLSEVAHAYRNKTATKASKDSHSPNGPWDKTQPFQTIHYELVLDGSPDSLSREYIKQWKAERADLKELFAAA